MLCIPSFDIGISNGKGKMFFSEMVPSIALFLMLIVIEQVMNVSYHNKFYEFPIVKTSSGYVRGKTVFLPRGKAVQSFLGIPYAKAPLGNLRFKHPIPVDPWINVINATKFGNTCYQKKFYYFKNFPGFDRLNPRTRFSEDCLTINVFVPLPAPTTRAVMVFIHGGGFAIGGTSTPLYDGKYLAAAENIIVVSMNYR